MSDADMYSDSNLIINYIPQQLTDDELWKLFSNAGTVKSCRIIRDRETGLSYGFGFCNYETNEEAQVAIHNFNGYKINNKVLKVAFARLPGQDSKNCNLYIQNLPVGVSKLDLENKYACYGKIVQCRVIKDNNTGASRRIGFVLFETRASAESALEMTDNKPFGESSREPIFVRFADDNSKKVRNPGGGSDAVSGGFEQFSSYGNRGAGGGMDMGFQNYGADASLWQNPGSGGGGPMRHAGMYYSGGNRYNPIMGGGMTGGMTGGFGVQTNQNNASPGSSYVLYVYNCGNSTTKEELQSLFSRFGSVIKADVPTNADGTSKNFAFLSFADYQGAVTAIAGMNGYSFNGKQLQVSFKKGKNS